MIDSCVCQNCGIDYLANEPQEVSKDFIEAVDNGEINIDGDFEGNAVYSDGFCKLCAKNYLDKRY